MYIFLLFLIIMFPSVLFCSVDQAISFFEKQFKISTSSDIDLTRSNHFDSLMQEASNNLKTMYQQSDESNKIVFNFKENNHYNLFTIGFILLAAANIKEECPKIFDFLEINGLCRKDCGSNKGLLCGRSQYFNFNAQDKKFDEKISKFVQLFLHCSLLSGTSFNNLLKKKNTNYKDKLFDIVAQHYVYANDIKILRIKHNRMDQCDKERHNFKLLIDKYDAKHKKSEDNKVGKPDEQIDKVKNQINQNLNDLLEEQKKKIHKNEGKKLVELSNAINEIEERGGTNLSSYIPYLIGGTILVSFLYFFIIKKQPSKNSSQAPEIIK